LPPLSAQLHQAGSQANGTTQAKRVVVTPDGLISALQGKLQQEAEKAVQAALGKQVNDSICGALRMIDDARESSVREVQKILPQVEELKRSLKEEFATQLRGQLAEQLSERGKVETEASRGRAEELTRRLEMQAEELRRELANAAREYAEKMTREIGAQVPTRLSEVVRQATADFENATAAVVGQRYAQMLENMQAATREAMLNLNARSAELQALTQDTVNAGLDEFRLEAERQATRIAETQERAASALSSLDAENRAVCDARRQALE